MAFVPHPSAASPDQRGKYRLRFRKGGDLRLVSHHDLMHCFERMLRRAGLPFCTTQGFHPQPRMVFAQSLALGIAGLNEVLELELKQQLPAEDVFQRLVRQAPPGIEFSHIKVIDLRARARVRRAFFHLPLAGPQEAPGMAGLPAKIATLLAADVALVERRRPTPRRLNVRPYIHELSLTPEGLAMTLWVSPYGSARPDEIAHLLELDALLAAGAFFSRTNLELYDEIPGDDGLTLPAVLRELNHQAIDLAPHRATEPRTAADAPLRPTALIAHPLSFDS